MNWIKCDEDNLDSLKEGTIAKTLEGEFVIVGKINCSRGTNDEFTKDITHYTEDLVEEMNQLLQKAKDDFIYSHKI